MFQQLLKQFLQKFVKNMGRQPQTPGEWMRIQDEAVRYLNKTKGAPPITKKPFQGFNPRVIEGGKGQNAPEISGIDSLLKSDFEKAVKPKKDLKTVEDLKDKGDWDPYGMAEGGIAPLVGEPTYAADFYDDRTPMEEGGMGKYGQQKDFDRFLNERKDAIREQDLDRLMEQYKQWYQRNYTQFEEAAQGGRIGLAGGGLIRLKQLQKMFPRIHVDSLLEASRIKDPNKLKQLLNSFRKTEQSIDEAPSSELFNFDSTGRTPNATGGLARVGMFKGKLAKGIIGQFTKAEVLIQRLKNTLKGSKDPYVQETFPNFIKEITENPKLANDPNVWKELGGDLPYNQRLIVHSDDSVTFQTRKGSPSKMSKPTKTLEGLKKEGTIDISNPEVADEFSRFMKESDPKGYKDIEQKIQIEDFDVTGRKKNASGGRAEFIFGGSAGLKAMWKQMLKNLSKGKDKPVKRLFPTLSAEERAMEKVVMGTPEQKAFREGEAAYKLEGIDLLINRMKHDKKIIERQAKNKAIGDPGLDFLMKKLEENMSQAYSPHLKKYTDIDKDILQMENIKKNLIMKDRKLNAEGGRVSYSGGGRAGLPAITYGTPHMNMQGPQMPAGPQPAGIPGGTIVAKNQMQQAPWMGPQMQQGIGGMPRPQPGGMPRPMAAEGGRIGFKFGGIDKGRRAFMKWLAGITGAGIAAGSGILKFGKAAKVVPKVTETIVQSNAAGMPPWFPSLVKKVLKEGEDVSQAAGAMERQTVHSTKLPESGTELTVTRDLSTDDIIVDIGMGKHGWSSGFHGQPTRLVLKKGEWIEPTKGKKGIKTKDEFSVEEAEFTGGHPENIKFEESTIEKYGEHGSDFTEVEKYATGKTTKKSKAQKEVWEADWDDSLPDYEDYASGGLAHLLGE